MDLNAKTITLTKNPNTYGLKTDKVIVYVLSNDAKSEEVKNTVNIFRDSSDSSRSYFDVKVVTMPTTSGERLISERKRILGALEDAEMKYPNHACIIIKDTSISFVDPKTLANTIKVAITEDNFHIFYLKSWMDDCSSRSDVNPISPGIITVRTRSPHGLQALCFTPHGRSVVLGLKEGARERKLNFTKSTNLNHDLNKAVLSGDLIALLTPLSLVEIDPLKVGKDYYKFNECAQGTRPSSARVTFSETVETSEPPANPTPTRRVTPQQGTTISPWLLAIIIAVILLGIILARRRISLT